MCYLSIYINEEWLIYKLRLRLFLEEEEFERIIKVVLKLFMLAYFLGLVGSTCLFYYFLIFVYTYKYVFIMEDIFYYLRVYNFVRKKVFKF